MKVLYTAYRHDPRDPDLSSGADYNFYTAIQGSGTEVEILLPQLGHSLLPEWVLKRIHKSYLGTRYAKFPFTKVWRASSALNRIARTWKPDIVFTIFPPSLVFYQGEAPCVYRLDTTFWGWQQNYPEFSSLGLTLSMWQEKRAFARCAKVITHSDWSKEILLDKYGLSSDKVEMFANPAALPEHVVPACLNVRELKALTSPLRLLLVGKDYHRKGVDIAIEVVRQLNHEGVPAELTICGGPKEEDQRHVRYVGYFRKSKVDELQQYVDLYRRAHLLLHPARFDPSPIATSEAAAFGVPAITNATGGIPTSVKDGESGIVLPQGSPPGDYVKAIVELVNDQKRYYALCESARRRYERELNWDAAGEKLMAILQSAVEASRNKGA